MRSPVKRVGRSADSPGVKLKYTPQGKTLAQFHERNEFVRIVIGPLGSGKTFAAISQILRSIHEQTPNSTGVRKSRWCVARNSLPDLLSTTIPDVKAVVDQMNIGEWGMGKVIAWRCNYRRKDGTTVEGEVMFRSFDGEQDVVKARGMQLSGIWVDELGEFHKTNLDMLIGRVKRYPSKVEVPHAKFECLGTSNAVAKDHWLAEIALKHQPPPNWWVGIQPGGVLRQGNTWVENPRAENRKNLPSNYYLDQCGGKKESWIRQNLANEFVHHSDGRPVHPSFNEQIHVAPVQATYGLPLYVGIDFGRTPAAVIGQRQVNGQWYFLKELVTTNMGADKFGPLLKDFLNEHFAGFTVAEITGDPSGDYGTQSTDDTAFDLLAAGGIHGNPAYTNDPQIRYAALDAQLGILIEGQPGLLVDPSCVTLIRGLAGEYCFRRIQVVGAERYTDKPDKGVTSHVCEASHYLMLGAGEGEMLFNQSWEIESAGIDSWAPPDKYFE